MQRSIIIIALTLILFAAWQAPAGSAGPAKSSDQPGTARSPQQTLEELDTRRPVPLSPMMALHQKENMRDHLKAVQEIIAALAANDYAAVESSASRMGYSEKMGQMCQMMGAGAPGFTEIALNFHHTADTIGEAARKKDRDAVLAALSNTLTTCVGCHATFKQQIVDSGSSSHGQ